MYDENESIGLSFKKLKRSYNLGKLASFSNLDYYNLIESAILGQELDESHRRGVLSEKFDNIDLVIHRIKTLSMEMHRYMPTDWNCFLDVTLV